MHSKPIEPIYEEIKNYNIKHLMKLFAFKKDLVILSSSRLMDDYGRYSFISFDAFASFYTKGVNCYWNNKKIEVSDPFAFINKEINKYKIQKVKELPPLQGGAIGYFGYEASHYLEKLPDVIDQIKLPDLYLRFFSNVIAIDHMLDRCWVIATGFPEQNYNKRLKLAKASLDKIKAEINQNNIYQFTKNKNTKIKNFITSNFTKENYIKAVNCAKEYILNGDIFEVNVTQQFKAKLLTDLPPIDLYFYLYELNPAPFSAFMKIYNYGYIVSASPERFVKLTKRQVETCPIKGTRPRSKNSREDRLLADELLASEKDHAENVMIVDLMRNDLSKVCQPHSINVEELCCLKSFATVHHLVSKITGHLQDELNAIDLIKATFPPGSITGAPKIRAMEIISELEKQTRGPYCGVIGYFSFTGDLDTSVIIRTYFINDQNIFFSTGGAIVLDSDPKEEYVESMIKAKPLTDVLNGIK